MLAFARAKAGIVHSAKSNCIIRHAATPRQSALSRRSPGEAAGWHHQVSERDNHLLSIRRVKSPHQMMSIRFHLRAEMIGIVAPTPPRIGVHRFGTAVRGDNGMAPIEHCPCRIITRREGHGLKQTHSSRNNKPTSTPVLPCRLAVSSSS